MSSSVVPTLCLPVGKAFTNPNSTNTLMFMLFRSSVDTEHFAGARSILKEPTDQASIPHPRIGFYGVIDERLDIELLRNAASARPDWHWVIVGPIVKIDPADLPRSENVHYLGSKSYKELPVYLAGWDVAMLPFARNESTRFISPTKPRSTWRQAARSVYFNPRWVRPYQALSLCASPIQQRIL
ncbi:MAG: hypothetical protein WKF84_21970 [Pyrinomonadaceae bacterium]